MGAIKSSTTDQQKTIEALRKQLQQKNKKINNLKKQNQTLIKQVMPSNKLTKQYTLENLMQMNYQMFTCLMCQNFFDQNKHVPIMVCKNQHTMCQICFKQKQSKKQQRCFSCEQSFKNYGKNRSVLHLITNKDDLLNWLKQRDAGVQNQTREADLQSQSLEKMMVHICRFPSYQTMFQMNGDSILKISPQAAWHTIRSVEFLPQCSFNQVSFKIISSTHNSLIIGITTQNQQFQKGFIPSSGIAFHLNNGHVYEQQQPNKFKWKNSGSSVAKNTSPRIIMSVNTIDKTVKWKIQGQIYASSKIPEKFMNQKIYIFVAIYHKGDMIVMNK